MWGLLFFFTFLYPAAFCGIKNAASDLGLYLYKGLSLPILSIILVKLLQICQEKQGKIASVEGENPRPPSHYETHVHETRMKVLTLLVLVTF